MVVDSGKSPFDRVVVQTMKAGDKLLLVLSIDGIRVKRRFFVCRPLDLTLRRWVRFPHRNAPSALFWSGTRKRLAGPQAP